jgi:DNA invertase Pin-like site-specific DNA recombinase
MGTALVVQRTRLPQSQSALRAAQYVRMSTDYQRYSIENQAAVIAAYAQAHGLTIIRTYRDEGQSGLKLKNRLDLIRLLDDVQSGHADFNHILVYDVNRSDRRSRQQLGHSARRRSPALLRWHLTQGCSDRCLA